MHRRTALRTGAALFCGTTLAGCLDTLGSESAWRDLVIDRPDEIYVPPKADGMVVWANETNGESEEGGREYALALSATRPHRFWTVTGRETNQISMRDAHSAHLMVSVWEPESGRLLPAEVRISIERSGESVLDRTLWPMLSQRMGFHYGDNVALPDAGEYRASVRVLPLGIAYRGGFEGGFEPASFDLGFEYDPDGIEALDLTVHEESRRGRSGAVEPMEGDHGHGHEDGDGNDHEDHDGPSHPPVPIAPPAEAFPTVVGEEQAGDYRLVVATADHEEGTYLIASPRTPYNGFPLPFCSLSAEVDRGSSGAESVSLAEATDPEFGHHYGAVVESFSGAELTVGVESPPQITRHEGYETAFFDLPELSLRAP
ncbi:DUF7350 domain-containing protein [Halalkalicoccus tibetensis]|uniref:DUF7350 domain-containing protein n=1 Tax=Halalkalicoccus tibetensis TaxID=175632 RepID=A0ABD5V809_9EURY